eukprot:9881614-Alexandrium_andersonii.AAC.1
MHTGHKQHSPGSPESLAWRAMERLLRASTGMRHTKHDGKHSCQPPRIAPHIDCNRSMSSGISVRKFCPPTIPLR